MANNWKGGITRRRKYGGAPIAAGGFGCVFHLVADAQHQLRGRAVHLELDGFEVAAPAGALIHDHAPNRQKWEGLFDRKFGITLGLNLGHDARVHAIEQQPNSRRLSGRATPALNQRLDTRLVVVRQMREANTELADVWTALMRPHDAADELNRLAGRGVIQLAT